MVRPPTSGFSVFPTSLSLLAGAFRNVELVSRVPDTGLDCLIIIWLGAENLGTEHYLLLDTLQ